MSIGGPEGLTMNDRLMNLQAGWFVVYKDGSLVTEDECHWDQVKKIEIKILGLKWKEKIWTIRDKTSWVQFKRGSVPFSTANIEVEINCTERCIGYYEGNKKVIYRVNNYTGKMMPDVV